MPIFIKFLKRTQEAGIPLRRGREAGKARGNSVRVRCKRSTDYPGRNVRWKHFFFSFSINYNWKTYWFVNTAIPRSCIAVLNFRVFRFRANAVPSSVGRCTNARDFYDFRPTLNYEWTNNRDSWFSIFTYDRVSMIFTSLLQTFSSIFEKLNTFYA